MGDSERRRSAHCEQSFPSDVNQATHAHIHPSVLIQQNATDYTESWRQYVDTVVPLIAKNQISSGGPVILVQLEKSVSLLLSHPDFF